VRKTGTSGYIYGYYNYCYDQPTGHMSVQRNVFENIKNNTYIYAFYNYASYTTPPSGYPATVATIKHNVIDSVDMTGTTGTAYLYNYMGYGGFDSTEVCYNVLRNVWTSLTATNYV